MWFEVDGYALRVQASDRSLEPVLDAVPLPLYRHEPSLPSMGTLSLRTCSPAQLRSEAEAFVSAPGERLRLPAAADTALAVDLLITPPEAILLLPDHGVATISSDGTRADVMVTEPDGLPAAALAATAVLAMIAERGFTPIHASLAARDGAGVMFCGERSRGKTSSCLALARAGWAVRADDRCFLRVRDGLPVVWGPGGGDMRLRLDSATLWPDLGEAIAQGRALGGKRVIQLAELGYHASAGSVTCRALMFPDVIGSGAHTMEPMPPAEALGEMLFSTGLAALPAHAARQFRDVTVLLDRTPCYRLSLGRDMDLLPMTIAEVLA